MRPVQRVWPLTVVHPDGRTERRQHPGEMRGTLAWIINDNRNLLTRLDALEADVADLADRLPTTEAPR